MGKINFQFHALKEETSSYLFDTIQKYRLTFALVKTFPQFEYEISSPKHISFDAIMDTPELLLFQKQPIEGATSYIDFLQDNIGFLSIMLGKQENTICMLGESKISGEASDQSLSLWKKIIANYKKHMVKGAYVVSNDGNTECYYKNHYYTLAAQGLYYQGWTICPIAGNCAYKLADPLFE